MVQRKISVRSMQQVVYLNKTSVCFWEVWGLTFAFPVYFLFVFITNSSSGWVFVTSLRKVVKLCPHFWAPSPPVWESWTWATTTCRTQEWSCSLLDWRVHNVAWKLSGQLILLKDEFSFFNLSSIATLFVLHLNHSKHNNTDWCIFQQTGFSSEALS